MLALLTRRLEWQRRCRRVVDELAVGCSLGYSGCRQVDFFPLVSDYFVGRVLVVLPGFPDLVRRVDFPVLVLADWDVEPGGFVAFVVALRFVPVLLPPRQRLVRLDYLQLVGLERGLLPEARR